MELESGVPLLTDEIVEEVSGGEPVTHISSINSAARARMAGDCDLSLDSAVDRILNEKFQRSISHKPSVPK